MAQHEAHSGARTLDGAASIGSRVAAHRARRGVKVSELARAIGVSASLISQIERGQSRPSVSTLYAIAGALDVPMDAFREGDGLATTEPEQPLRLVEAPRRDRDARRVVRRDARDSFIDDGGVRWERLTPRRLADLEFMELAYAPGAESNAALYRHPGIEMVLVLQGRLTIFIGFERHELEEGDSICFPSATPHRYVNTTAQTTRAVTVIVPDGATANGPATNQRRP
jgi:transcriptional regulator with XRE-family HTH domain